MKNWRQIVLVVAALALTACGPIQCAAGWNVNQSITYDNSGSILAFVALCIILVLAIAALVGSVGLGGGDERQ